MNKWTTVDHNIKQFIDESLPALLESSENLMLWKAFTLSVSDDKILNKNLHPLKTLYYNLAFEQNKKFFGYFQYWTLCVKFQHTMTLQMHEFDMKTTASN